jgi:hypothetical protein
LRTSSWDKDATSEIRHVGANAKLGTAFLKTGTWTPRCRLSPTWNFRRDRRLIARKSRTKGWRTQHRRWLRG